MFDIKKFCLVNIFTMMYHLYHSDERFAKTAKEEGFTRIAALFEMVGKIEKEHEERYRKLLERLKDGSLYKDGEKVFWICTNCGHIHFGEKAPEKCPVCAHPQGYFERRVISY